MGGGLLHGFDYSERAAELAELAEPGSFRLEMLCAKINMRWSKRRECSGSRVDSGFSVGENDGGMRDSLIVIADELLRLGCLV